MLGSVTLLAIHGGVFALEGKVGDAVIKLAHILEQVEGFDDVTLTALRTEAAFVGVVVASIAILYRFAAKLGKQRRKAIAGIVALFTVDLTMRTFEGVIGLAVVKTPTHD